MGDAYKGLTIRIGADMTELNRALRSSNSAIAQTQKQLRLLEKQSKLDPANVALYAQKMDMLNDRAQALTARLSTLKQSRFMQQLGEDTEDAALKAKLADNEYAKVCDTIKRLKNSIATAAGFDLKKEDPFKGIKEGSKAAIAKMRELGASEEQVAEYLALVDRHAESLQNKRFTHQLNDISKFKTQLATAGSEARQLYEEMARMVTANPSMTQTKQFEKFRNEMKRAEAAATELRTELSKMDEALDLDPQNIEAARIKMANMQEQVRLNVVQLDSLKEQIDSFKAAGIDKVSAKFPDLKQKIASVEGEVADLSQKLDTAKARLLELGADTSIDKQSKRFQEAERQVREYEERLTFATKSLERLGNAQEYRNATAQHAALSSAVTKLADDMQDAGNKSAIMRGSMQQLGWAMYSTLTPAMTMFGYSAINSAETVDAAYRNMRKTVQGTEEQFEALKQGAIDFSRTHVTSADQILEIQAMGGQLGIATENLAAFAETVSNIEIATNLDAETAAQQLGQLQGMLNDMTENDFDNFGDALVRLGNNNATLEDKIMNVMLRIASMGTITGFTTTELLAWSTAVAATGQGAEAAGTAISKTFSDIEAAVGAGGAELKAFADIAQMSSEQFADAWSNDPSSAMYAFINGLKTIEANGGSADAALEGLGITSVRQKQSLLGLMQTIDGLNDNLQMSNDAWNGVSDKWGAAGDAAREADRKADGFSGTIQILRHNIQAFGVEMGESLAWAIELLGEFVANATQAYSDLPNFAKQMINFGALAAAGLGPMLVATNAVVGAGGDLVKGIKSTKTAWSETVKKNKQAVASLVDTAAATVGVTNATTRATGAIAAMSKAQKALALGAAGAGILAVVATIMLIADQYQKAEEKATNLRKATEGLNQSMKVTSQSFVDAANSINSTNYTAVIHSIGNVGEALNEAIAKQAEMADRFTETWADINGSEYALESYLEVITQLTNKYDENGNAVKLTAAEQGKLAAAVAGYNEIMGTSVEVTDAQNGKLSVSTQELVKNADAWIDNAKAQAAQQQMVELQQQQLTNVINLKNAEMELSIAQAQLNAAIARGEVDLSQYQGAVDSAERKVDSATSAMEANEKQVEELTREYYLSNNALNSLVSGLGITEDEFIQFAKILGIEGEEAVNNFAAAILGGEDEVAGSAAIIQAAARGMADGKSAEWGYHLVQAFANGMNLAKTLVTSVATNIANATKNILGHSIAKEGPFHNHGKGEAEWGAHLVRNFTEGMESEIGNTVKVADQLAASVADSLTSTGLTMQAKVAGEFASSTGAASSQVVNNNSTSNSTNHYTVYIEANDLSGINAVEEFVQLLERSR